MLEQLIVESTVEPNPHLYLGLLGIFMLFTVLLMLGIYAVLPDKVDPVVIQGWKEVDANLTPIVVLERRRELERPEEDVQLGRTWSH